MSLQELPHPCQLREWVSCHILVSQHLPDGVGFVCLLLHECMEQGLICLGAHQFDMCSRLVCKWLWLPHYLPKRKNLYNYCCCQCNRETRWRIHFPLVVLYRNEVFQAATQIRVYFTFIRCCHFACFAVQRSQAWV